MVRFLLAVLAGAVVYFVWGFAAWMFLGLHTDSMRGLPNEDAVKQVLSEQQLSPGYYIVPMMPIRTESMTDEEWEAAEESFMERHRQGPIVSLIYAEGAEPMPPSMMIGGFVNNLVGAALLGMIMVSATCCRSYWQRVGLGMAMGLFLAVGSYGALYTWMLFPADYTASMMLDVIIGWTLSAVAMAAIIRPGAPPEAAGAS